MEVHTRVSGDLLEVIPEGALDNESSTRFREVVDEALRDGWHRLVVDLERLTYISSAGIGALLAARKRFDVLHGTFGVYGPVSEVERVLRQTRVLDTLLCDPDTLRNRDSAGSKTVLTRGPVVCVEGIDFQVFALEKEAELTCRLIGDPAPLASGVFAECDAQRVAFPPTTFGLGMGALGQDMAEAQFGEFLAAAGAVTTAPPGPAGRPDYLVHRGDYVPDLHALYGLQCEGSFRTLLRFDAAEPGQPVRLAELLRESLRIVETESAGFVALAETAGLLGARLRRSPTTAPEDGSRFDVPGIRDWVVFGAEPVHDRALALVVGVVRNGNVESSLSRADHLLRPLDREGELLGHVHAAVFPYRPLKKRTLDLEGSVGELFESGGIRDVLHLLCDDRPESLVDDSYLLGGGIWLSPIGDTVRASA